MDSLTATLQTRLQTTNASTHQSTLQIQQEAELLPSLTDYPARFRHVIYVRLTRHEKLQLEREVFRYGYRGFSGEREVAEELARNPTVENEGVALAVFWGWEWAGAVLRGVVGCFEREGDGDGEVDDVVEWLMERLSIRDDEILPESVRRRRVEELVGDGVNGEFFAAFGDRGGRDEMRRMHPRGYVVAPHPDDLVVWRLLAYQVEKNSRVLRMWPGLHEGAAIAGGWGVEYPYFEVWEEGEEGDSGGEDKSIGEPEVNELGLDIASLDLGSQWGSKDITEERNQDDEAKVTYAATDTSTGSGGSVSYDDDDLNLTISTTSSVRRRNKQRDDLCALFEASDVWDVWTFCQMLRCEEAIWGVDQCPGTEQGFYLLEKLPTFRETWIKREVGPRYSKCGFLQRRVGSEDAAVPGASEVCQRQSPADWRPNTDKVCPLVAGNRTNISCRGTCKYLLQLFCSAFKSWYQD